MESFNTSESEFDVTELSDAELAQKLRQLGANIGPVTG
jgi:LEM domain